MLSNPKGLWNLHSASIMISMNQSAHLYQLQKIDQEIDRIHQRTKEIDALLQNNEKLLGAERKISEAKKRTHQSRQELRAIEDEVKSVTLRKEQSESSLYSGKIKNPKELQDLENEIALFKKRILTLEDAQLEKMIQSESFELEEDEASVEYLKIQADCIGQNAELKGEKENLENKLTRLSLEREATLRSIDAKNLITYNNLRQTKRGIAVAVIQETSCTACGASLRPAEIQSANSPNAMFFCSSCGRILFSG